MRTKTTKTYVLFHPTSDKSFDDTLFKAVFAPTSKGKRIHLSLAFGYAALENKRSSVSLAIPKMPGVYIVYARTEGPWYNRKFKTAFKKLN